MTKREMINEMFELGCIKESDCNYLIRSRTKDELERLYNSIVPMRKEYLKKEKKEG